MINKELKLTLQASQRAYGVISPIIKEITRKLRDAEFDIINYSLEMTDITISVNCFSDEETEMGFGKPYCKMSYKTGTAKVGLPMPYDELLNADKHTQYLMVVKNIYDELKDIDDHCVRKRRARFDSKLVMKDILKILNIDKKELKNIVGVKEYKL